MDKIEKLSDIYQKLYQISCDIYESDEYNAEMVETRIFIEDELERSLEALKNVISTLKDK